MACVGHTAPSAFSLLPLWCQRTLSISASLSSSLAFIKEMSSPVCYMDISWFAYFGISWLCLLSVWKLHSLLYVATSRFLRGFQMAKSRTPCLFICLHLLWKGRSTDCWHHLPSHLSVTSLASSTTLSHSAASQSLVMSPGGVASDGSVTLTLADAQGMLDGVTLNLNTQVRKKRKWEFETEKV